MIWVYNIVVLMFMRPSKICIVLKTGFSAIHVKSAL